MYTKAVYGGKYMNFLEIAQTRQSCRNFDNERPVEQEKIEAILNATILAPSACNSQPYHFTVCKGETAKRVAAATTEMGMNKFTKDAPVMIVITEENYSPTAALGAKAKGLDYRSMDIGIATAYLTAQAHEEGLSTCILGWLNDKKIREIINIDKPVRLVIALGYAAKDDKLRTKKRKSYIELVSKIGE